MRVALGICAVIGVLVGYVAATPHDPPLTDQQAQAAAEPTGDAGMAATDAAAPGPDAAPPVDAVPPADVHLGLPEDAPNVGFDAGHPIIPVPTK